jgi:hypothetical protein
MERIYRSLMVLSLLSLFACSQGNNGSGTDSVRIASELRSKSVARLWNEALLEAIRIDTPAPTVHSRNLFHVSAGMYDAWAAYDHNAEGFFYKEKVPLIQEIKDVEQARKESVSYAAYRILSYRYALASLPEKSQQYFDEVMNILGYDKEYTSTSGNSPAALGNRIAAYIIESNKNDGSNELNGYVDNTGYVNINPFMIVDYPSYKDPDPDAENDLQLDPNRWQRLYIFSFTFQNGIVSGENLQDYIGPHWGNVKPFALGVKTSPSPYPWSDIDPGEPPKLNGIGDKAYREETVEVIRYSHYLDPFQGAGEEYINISPRVRGNRPLGTHEDRGFETNPVTGETYPDQFVKRADYGRILAEFWADGPDSETPPGHWNVIANSVSDYPGFEKRIEGKGPIVDDLEWDIKLYLALNGAAHDAAVAAWGTKRQYDYVRPITKIRYQGAKGQSSDPNLASYHPDGLPLIEDLIEISTLASLSEGGKHYNAYVNANRDHTGGFFENISREDMAGKIVLKGWAHEPESPKTQLSGIDWILAENWVPYQRNNFVTPAFPAYVSGHSTFSRAAAEVLTAFTGSPYFPGGLGQKTFKKDQFLHFEIGPSEDVTLQWATYYDAADEAGISRLWGGIHVAPDDFKGREMGARIGQDAFVHAKHFWHHQ